MFDKINSLRYYERMFQANVFTSSKDDTGLSPAGTVTKRGWAAITGASSGLGRSFALACSRRGYDLCIADRPGTGLQDLARRIAEGGTQVRTLECDLAGDEGRSAFLAMAGDPARPLALLVNKYGYGMP